MRRGDVGPPREAQARLSARAGRNARCGAAAQGRARRSADGARGGVPPGTKLAFARGGRGEERVRGAPSRGLPELRGGVEELPRDRRGHGNEGVRRASRARRDVPVGHAGRRADARGDVSGRRVLAGLRDVHRHQPRVADPLGHRPADPGRRRAGRKSRPGTREKPGLHDALARRPMGRVGEDRIRRHARNGRCHGRVGREPGQRRDDRRALHGRSRTDGRRRSGDGQRPHPRLGDMRSARKARPPHDSAGRTRDRDRHRPGRCLYGRDPPLDGRRSRRGSARLAAPRGRGGVRDGARRVRTDPAAAGGAVRPHVGSGTGQAVLPAAPRRKGGRSSAANARTLHPEQRVAGGGPRALGGRRARVPVLYGRRGNRRHSRGAHPPLRVGHPRRHDPALARAHHGADPRGARHRTRGRFPGFRPHRAAAPRKVRALPHAPAAARDALRGQAAASRANRRREPAVRNA